MTILDVEGLRQAVAAGRQVELLLFWGHTGTGLGKHVLSQWWPARFTLDGATYATAEHYMMAEKARLFGDAEARAAILAAATPAEAKALGRRVRGFEEAAWAARRFAIAVAGNAAKFGQNRELGGWLAATGEAVLVEASPVDRIWGIGLAADDARARDPAAWRGLNLLGFALMRVRGGLRG